MNAVCGHFWTQMQSYRAIKRANTFRRRGIMRKRLAASNFHSKGVKQSVAIHNSIQFFSAACPSMSTGNDEK
jgi:hypothetical protein